MKKLIILLVAIISISTAFSQDIASKTKAKQDTTSQGQYTCPMHPEVISNKPGKCPKCGMDLVKIKTKPTATKVFYTCPMDADVISDKPGTCPKCGMALVKKSN
ncbi:MAG TPA: heavy metal-binding domain-containing protein [Ferruginibacter sp.]|nr:heavy metal-binding domain-containing protein [Ferruginibacter sp.]